MSKKMVSKYKKPESEYKGFINKRSVIICSSLLFIAAAIAFLLLIFGQPANSARVAWVNNEPVTVKEFRQQILLKRGQVASYFLKKYGVKDNPVFWESSYGGENPSEVVKRDAFIEEKKIKIQLLLAQKEGLLNEISYKSLLETMKEENKTRKGKIENKQVVYGLSEFNEENYLPYLISDVAIKLKDKLSKNWAITDEEMQNSYEAMKDIYYVEGKSVKVKEIKISYVDENGNIDEKLKIDARNKIEEIENQLAGGKSFDEVAGNFYDGKDVPIHNFDNNTVKQDANLYPKLRELATKLNTGDVSRIIEDANAAYILKCIDSTNLSYTPYESVKVNIRSRLIDEKYNEYVEELADKAEVKINHRVYNKMRTDR